MHPYKKEIKKSPENITTVFKIKFLGIIIEYFLKNGIFNLKSFILFKKLLLFFVE